MHFRNWTSLEWSWFWSCWSCCWCCTNNWAL